MIIFPIHISTNVFSSQWSLQSKAISLNLLIYSMRSSPLLYMVPCKVANVTISSPWKYLVQNMSTISSQVGIYPGFMLVYQIYAWSHKDFENSQRQRSSSTA